MAWGKNPPTMQETACNAADVGLIPGSERGPGDGNGNPLLENPRDRGAWWAIVNGVARVGHDLVTKPPPPQDQIRNNLNIIIQTYSQIFWSYLHGILHRTFHFPSGTVL